MIGLDAEQMTTNDIIPFTTAFTDALQNKIRNGYKESKLGELWSDADFNLEGCMYWIYLQQF